MQQYLHEDIHDQFLERLVAAYGQVKIGDPLEEGTLCGPLHNRMGVDIFTRGIETIKAQVCGGWCWWCGCAQVQQVSDRVDGEQGGTIVRGGNVIDRPGNFVEPTIVTIDASAAILREELFVPILYVVKSKQIVVGGFAPKPADR
jgi:aldehyde dehydrogenase family 7 member A1